jgi:tetratricopeptide (TPR) repeat protein
MAEGLLGGILGDEEEKPEVEAPAALAGAEAFAAAIAAIASRQDPQVARDTSEFLRTQTQLLEIQAEHLKDEHSARLQTLLGEAREVGIRRLGLRLRVAFQLFIALVATVIGLGVAGMLREAFTARSVVIDPFDSPPALADSGINGKVLASGLLDVLTRIQAANRSSAEHRSLSNAWTNEISLEIPETGLSIAQLQRILRAHLGHDLHIEGNLLMSGKTGLALTVRGTGVLPRTFTDEAGALDKLLTQAGEYVYSQSQPGLWAWYLGDKGRADEAIRFSREAYAAADPSERPYLLNGWANALVAKGGEGALREALRFYQEAVRLKPDYLIGMYNVMEMLSNLGQEEGVLPVGEQMVKAAGGRPGRADENMYQYVDVATWNLQALREGFISDMASHGGVGSITGASGSENLNVAQVDVQLHDVRAAELGLKTTQVDPDSAADRALGALARGLLAAETGDFAAAAREMDVLQAAYSNPVVYTNFTPAICFAPPIFEAAGLPAKADAALATAGNQTFVDCHRFKGDILDGRGDWAGAQEWYAKTVRLAPSLPAGYYSWGLALAKHGDLAGAAAKLRDANQRGPRWADPLKAWGDLLVKQGKSKDALAKYDEALKYAPNWQQLREAREALAKQKA